MNILVINGPNLNMLGQREPDVYGADTLDDIMAAVETTGGAQGIEVAHFQSNDEGAIVTAHSGCARPVRWNHH